MGDVMNPIVRLAPRGQQSDCEDLAAIEDFGKLLMILLAQPDAECAIPQMHRVAGLIVCHGREMQSWRGDRWGCSGDRYPLVHLSFAKASSSSGGA